MMKMLTWMTFCPSKEPFGKSETHAHRLELSTGGRQEAFEEIERDESQNRGEINPPNRRNHTAENVQIGIGDGGDPTDYRITGHVREPAHQHPNEQHEQVDAHSLGENHQQNGETTGERCCVQGRGFAIGKVYAAWAG